MDLLKIHSVMFSTFSILLLEGVTNEIINYKKSLLNLEYSGCNKDTGYDERNFTVKK